MKQLLILSFLIPLIGGAQIGTVEVRKKPIPIPRTINRHIDSLNRMDPFYSYLSTAEKEHFYWLNYSRTNPKLFWDSAIQPILDQFPNLKGNNAKSLKEDLLKSPPLTRLYLNKSLISIAQTQANDNLKQGRLSHTNSKGKRFDQRIREVGIKRCASENLVMGPSNTLFALILLYLDIEVPDLGHRKNLLNPQYAEIGLGVASKTGETIYIVQDFACTQ